MSDGRRPQAVGIELLVELGLTLREARAYLALLERGPGTAVEVADAAGMSRPKIYEALKSLEHGGFCVVRGGRAARFEPVDPAEALSEWARRREQERAVASGRDERLVRELVDTLPAPARPGEDGGRGYMRAEIGADRALALFAEITGRAVRRLDLVVTAPVLQSREDWHVDELAALERSVRVRVIYESQLLADTRRYTPLTARGAEARRSDDLPLKMIVRDDGDEAAVALVDTTDGVPLVTSVSIRHPELASPYQLLFNRQWRRAAALPAD